MIITLFLYILGGLITGVFWILPTVSISTIWFIGPFVSSTLDTVILTWNAFMVTFPYAQISWNVFLYGIISFEITMAAAKLLLGHRAPNHTTN